MTPRDTFRIGAGLGMAMLCGTTLCSADALAASGDCAVTGSVTSCTYSVTGSSQTFGPVPAGVQSVQINAAGAQGALYNLHDYYFPAADAPDPTSGGLGGQVSATVPVTPGDVLQVVVGGQGSKKTEGYNGGAPGGAGGMSTNTAPAISGGGGGGASDVRAGACAASLACPLGNRIVVAGGGGGFGLDYVDRVDAGGAAGAAGVGGVYAGDPGNATKGGHGGGYGMTGAGCTVDNAGSNGGQGVGGNGQAGSGNSNGGGGNGGGGGGGGYFGGGGGSGGECYSSFTGSGSGGGGGGSNYGPVGAQFAAGHSGPGLVTISYTTGGAVPVPSATPSPPPTPPATPGVTPQLGIDFKLPRFTDKGDPVTVDFHSTAAANVTAYVYNGRRVVKRVTTTADAGKNSIDIPTRRLPEDVKLFVRLAAVSTDDPTLHSGTVDSTKFTVRNTEASSVLHHKKKHRKHAAAA